MAAIRAAALEFACVDGVDGGVIPAAAAGGREPGRQAARAPRGSAAGRACRRTAVDCRTRWSRRPPVVHRRCGGARPSGAQRLPSSPSTVAGRAPSRHDRTFQLTFQLPTGRRPYGAVVSDAETTILTVAGWQV